MRTIALSGICFALLLFTGCARSRVTTEIKSGGAWSRTVVFTGPAQDSEFNKSVDSAFVFPKGDGWTNHKVPKNDEVVVTYEKAFAIDGSSAGDVTANNEEGKVILANDVSVRRISPRRYEYREVLKWVGGPPKLIELKQENLAEIKAALPKALATDDNARAIAEKAYVLMIPQLFGPGDPLFAISLLHPDLAERRASQRIGVVILKALEDKFGAKMSSPERKEVARKLILTMFANTKPTMPDPEAAKPQERNTSGLRPLTFIVKSGGKVISSNGEVDDLTGEVYWALFPEAASLQPVVLTAVIEIP